jgi:hypothetical protein
MITFDPATGSGHGTPAEAQEYFDGLDPVDLEFMWGTWRGDEFYTGHQMDGMLSASGWYGKHFADAETVYPLLFHNSEHSSAFAVDPRRVPVGLRVPEGLPYHRLITGVAPLLRTTRPGARLRMTEYRGVLTATMIYDAKPINDVFRKVDGDTVLGTMDCRYFDQPYFFVLRRDPGKRLDL